MSVQATFQYGLVVRSAALGERNVPLTSLLEALETDAPLDQDDHLIVFGPHFDGDALAEMHKRLSSLGLVYVDDYFELVMDHPGWLGFRVEFVREESIS
jgi:hypothetical protein